MRLEVFPSPTLPPYSGHLGCIQQRWFRGLLKDLFFPGFQLNSSAWNRVGGESGKDIRNPTGLHAGDQPFSVPNPKQKENQEQNGFVLLHQAISCAIHLAEIRR